MHLRRRHEALRRDREQKRRLAVILHENGKGAVIGRSRSGADAQRHLALDHQRHSLKKGGLYEKKVDDGFEVLEVAKGSWIEAIFAKVKPEAEKPRMKFASHDGDGEEDEDADVEIEDTYNKPDEDDIEIEDPDDDDITEDNYSTMMDLGGGDPDEEAEGIAEYGDE